MVSPFRSHQMATRAALAAATGLSGAALPEIDAANPAYSEYQQLLASLHNDLRALHDIQSVQGKIDRKRSMIAAYLPWVQGALAAGETGGGVQDEVVATMLVWALDIQDWDLALAIGAHVLNHGLALPERYKRSAACLIAEEIADAAKAKPETVPFEVLQRTAALVAGHDMPDQVQAKLLRATGLDLMVQAENYDPNAESAVAGGKPFLVNAALAALRRALELNKAVGIKKQIEQLEREAKALAAAAAVQT